MPPTRSGIHQGASSDTILTPEDIGNGSCRKTGTEMESMDKGSVYVGLATLDLRGVRVGRCFEGTPRATELTLRKWEMNGTLMDLG